MAETPLIERARDYAAGSYSGHGLVSELADRIEELTRELQHTEAYRRAAVRRIDDQIDAIEELKAGLAEANARYGSALDDSLRKSTMYNEALERAEAAERALCGLTPGGSEYAGDVAACVAYVRKVRESQHDAIVSAVKARKEAERSAVETQERCARKIEEQRDDCVLPPRPTLRRRSAPLLRPTPSGQGETDGQPNYSHARAAERMGLPTEFPDSALDGQGDYVRVPREPSVGRLISMAIRADHALGIPGYYDNPLWNTSHRVLESAISSMRQLYEEATGQGFYRPEREDEYAALSTAPRSDTA